METDHVSDEIRCSIECREDEARRGPGRLVGRILTYGERATDRPELFRARGAELAQMTAIVLNRQHARGAPIMRVLPTLVGDELRIDQALPDTSLLARDAATEIRGGLMRESVGVVSGWQTVVCGRRAPVSSRP